MMFLRPPPSAKGFTLTELAIVLVIVSLLAGGLIMSLSSQYDLQAQKDTQKLLGDATDALVGFAASHTAVEGLPYLPCPDKTTAVGVGTPNDGQEDRDAAGACVTDNGNLPWLTLGLPANDAWNDHIRYAVTSVFANKITGFGLEPPNNKGTLRVCPDSACAAPLATELPFVLVSHGKNGLGAINSSGLPNAAPSDPEELENLDVSTFISHPPGVSFDDYVVWLSPNILFNRMIAANKLP